MDEKIKFVETIIGRSLSAYDRKVLSRWFEYFEGGGKLTITMARQNGRDLSLAQMAMYANMYRESKGE